jgi:hypothetical protein
MTCDHPEFRASVTVQRLTDDAGCVRNYIAEVTVSCRRCDEPFHFIGPPCGLAFKSPTVSVGATTLHAPIAPGELPVPSRISFELPGNPS